MHYVTTISDFCPPHSHLLIVIKIEVSQLKKCFKSFRGGSKMSRTALIENVPNSVDRSDAVGLVSLRFNLVWDQFRSGPV